MHTEAIVNTANEYVSVGTGCDSAVYKAARYDKLLKYRKEKIGFVPEGGAFITPGFNLEARYIIHAVSPRYKGGNQGEEKASFLLQKESTDCKGEQHKIYFISPYFYRRIWVSQGRRNANCSR